VLFAYVAVAFTIQIPVSQVLHGTFVPKISLDHDYLLLVVAVLGTTISPYLFFWQASQEVEEMRTKRARPRLPLKILTRGGGGELARITIDTTVGMMFSNVIAYFIILATAATLNGHGITRIQTAADAAEALRPIAGDAAFLLFALGIVGTGLLAIPVLAGSAGYAVAELFGWPSTLEANFPQAVGFYTIILAATVIGFAMGFLPLNPIQLLVWTAVINGIVAMPIMAMMMLIVTKQNRNGPLPGSSRVCVVGLRGDDVDGHYRCGTALVAGHLIVRANMSTLALNSTIYSTASSAAFLALARVRFTAERPSLFALSPAVLRFFLNSFTSSSVRCSIPMKEFSAAVTNITSSLAWIAAPSESALRRRHCCPAQGLCTCAVANF